MLVIDWKDTWAAGWLPQNWHSPSAGGRRAGGGTAPGVGIVDIVGSERATGQLAGAG
ncbi:hypothetical protein GCM10009848_43300 [Micromonospora lupini]